jgi:hypothetical protein
VRDTSGTRHNLTEALLVLMEPISAARWECPFFRVPFDMSGIGWIMKTNSRRGLPDPLLSRCPPLVLPPLSLSDLIGFAEREGAARGLTAPALDAIIETLQYPSSVMGRILSSAFLTGKSVTCALGVGDDARCFRRGDRICRSAGRTGSGLPATHLVFFVQGRLLRMPPRGFPYRDDASVRSQRDGCHIMPGPNAVPECLS